MNIGIIGAGKLAQGILRGWLDSKVVKPKNLWAVTRTLDSSRKVKRTLKISCTTQIDPKKLKKTQAVLLAAKPHHLEEVIAELKHQGLSPKTAIFSVMAGVGTDRIENLLQQKNPVVVTMTNTPSTVGEGMSTLFQGRWAKASHLNLAQRLFKGVGKTQVLDEKLFHEATALSASGPAFVYQLMQRYAQAGVTLGLDPNVAQALTVQTFLGAATLASVSKMRLEDLIAQVTTPGGCTIEGVKILESSSIGNVFLDTLTATRNKAHTL